MANNMFMTGSLANQVANAQLFKQRLEQQQAAQIMAKLAFDQMPRKDMAPMPPQNIFTPQADDRFRLPGRLTTPISEQPQQNLVTPMPEQVDPNAGMAGQGQDLEQWRRLLLNGLMTQSNSEGVFPSMPEGDIDGHSIMPETGTTFGDESMPIYRFVGGDALKPGDEYGIHWTHSLKEVEKMASEENGFIIKAKHPGKSNILDWDNKDDLPIMEKTIGGYKYRDKVFPEVPVKPNTKLNVLKITKIDSDGNRSKIR